MAQAVQSVGEQLLHSSENGSYTDMPKLDDSTSSQFSLLQNPKIAIGFCFLLMVVLGRVFGGKRLPAGAKPLPILPGGSKIRLG